MTDTALYPLSFDPIFQGRIWGGRRLAGWMSATLPGEAPIGEAWMLSDRPDLPSRVATGAFKGRTIAELIRRWPTGMLGDLAGRAKRFPLLIKYLDVAGMLSVQVHPPDDRTDLIPAGDTGKTEAWFVLAADEGSRIYAGLTPGTTAEDLRTLSVATAEAKLASFAPREGQSVLIEAGTVHAIGDGLLVLEVQENSDVTFRLFDWDHLDPATGRGRPLQVEQALSCVDFSAGPVEPTPPTAPDRAGRQKLLDCQHFRVWRRQSGASFHVGAAGEPRVVVCVDGSGSIAYHGAEFPLARGELLLLPAALGPCAVQPRGEITLLEIAAEDHS